MSQCSLTVPGPCPSECLISAHRSYEECYQELDFDARDNAAFRRGYERGQQYLGDVQKTRVSIRRIVPRRGLCCTGRASSHSPNRAQQYAFDIGSKIHGIAALSGLKTGDTTNIEKLRVDVRITNASVVVDKIDAVIPAVGELTGSGTVSSADQLDFNLVAEIDSAQGIRKVGAGLLTKLNSSGETSKNTTGVPLRVIGTPGDPSITADVGGIFQKKKKSIAAFFDKKK
jgi:hypothetical protein